MNKQNDLWCRNIDNLEQYGRRECLHFDKFEVSDAESSADCSNIVKYYIENELEVELNDDDYYLIHKIGLKREKNGDKYQQIIVKFRIFLSRTQVYRARKCKTKISVRLDLTKRRLDLRNSAYESYEASKDKLCLCRYQLLSLCFFKR